MRKAPTIELARSEVHARCGKLPLTLVRLSVFIILLILAFPSQIGAGQVILDQALDHCSACGTDTLAGTLAEGFAYLAQSATAGITGKLARIDLFIYRRDDFLIPWELQIIDAPGGIPNGDLLASFIVDLPTTSMPSWRSFDLPDPVHFRTGDSYVIAVHPQGIFGKGPKLLAGIWGGATGNLYTGGRFFVGTDPDNIFPLETVDPACQFCPGADLFFRTYVAVPEASSLVFMAVGFVLISSRYSLRRGKRRQQPGLIS